MHQENNDNKVDEVLKQIWKPLIRSIKTRLKSDRSFSKSEPFKLDKTMGVKDENDDENPETTHEPKGKRGRPPNVRKTI